MIGDRINAFLGIITAFGINAENFLYEFKFHKVFDINAYLCTRKLGMLKKLVKEEWWTDVVLTTDANGCVAVDAFKGDYELSIDGAKADVKIEDDKLEVVTIK